MRPETATISIADGRVMIYGRLFTPPPRSCNIFETRVSYAYYNNSNNNTYNNNICVTRVRVRVRPSTASVWKTLVLGGIRFVNVGALFSMCSSAIGGGDATRARGYTIGVKIIIIVTILRARLYVCAYRRTWIATEPRGNEQLLIYCRKTKTVY